MMKLIAKSKNGKMIKIGTDNDHSKWFFMTEDVKAKIDTFSDGDDITYTSKSEGGSEFVVTMIPFDGTTPELVQEVETPPEQAPSQVYQAPGQTPTPMATGAKPDTGVTPQREPYLSKEDWIAKKKADGTWKENYSSSGTPAKSGGSSDGRNTSIERQVCWKTAGELVSSMLKAGLLTKEEVPSTLDEIFRQGVAILA